MCANPAGIATNERTSGAARPSGTAYGDKAVYDPNTQLLHLTGHVIVVNSSGTVGSPELVVNMITNTSTFTATTGTRVTGVFTPQ